MAIKIDTTDYEIPEGKRRAPKKGKRFKLCTSGTPYGYILHPDSGRLIKKSAIVKVYKDTLKECGIEHREERKECEQMQKGWKVVDITDEDGDPVAWSDKALVTITKNGFDCILTGEE
tara:strand:- start:822 stop:1175 length:354 start_codon:yes stop_codon:yes gene_type:complete